MKERIFRFIQGVYGRIRLFLSGARKNDVFYIGGSESLPPPLSAEEEAACIQALDRGEASARSALIEHNLRLVVYIAKKFENTGVTVEDLISIGTIGLIKAVNTFDATKKIKLATYASRCIENEILMFLRRTSKHKMEVSIDEPLNVDWDGNELLLSDILGTEPDVVNKNIEAETEKELLRSALSKLSAPGKRNYAAQIWVGGQYGANSKRGSG